MYMVISTSIFTRGYLEENADTQLSLLMRGEIHTCAGYVTVQVVSIVQKLFQVTYFYYPYLIH